MAVTVEDMLTVQNEGFGLDAVTGVQANGQPVPWEQGVTSVWEQIALPYAKLKLGLNGQATAARTPSGVYVDGQRGRTIKPGTIDWKTWGLVAAAVAVGFVMLRRG